MTTRFVGRGDVAGLEVQNREMCLGMAIVDCGCGSESSCLKIEGG